MGAIGDFHSASKSGDTTNEVNTDPANFMTVRITFALLSVDYLATDSSSRAILHISLLQYSAETTESSD